MAARAPRGEVVRNPLKDGGFTYALRFTANAKRHYVTLGRPKDGWTDARAQGELQSTLAAVRSGTWRAWEPAPEPQQDPTFHQFSSEWFAATSDEWRENTRLDYEWQLRVHLLPFFMEHRLSQITVAEVDRYRNAKVAENRAILARTAKRKGKPRMIEYTDKRRRLCKRPERPLSASSVNRTITRLGQILEVALERELIARNPAKVGGKRRRMKSSQPLRVYLDRAEQLAAVLDAAGKIDADSRPDQWLPRRAMLATLALAGLRISELLDLQWRDVDLAVGRLRVRHSKTDAGVRYVKLLPRLRDELSSLKARGDGAGLVFPSARGTHQDRNRVRGRVLAGAVKSANKTLAADGLTALPEGITLHALRRTWASVKHALGCDERTLMEEGGWTSSAMLLDVYAQVIPNEVREGWRQYVEGADLAVAGSGSVPDEAPEAGKSMGAGGIEPPASRV